jgi:hypothetical protein
VEQAVFFLSWRAEDIGGGKDQIMAILKKSGICDRTVDSEHMSLLQWTISIVRSEQDGVGVEVPCAHLTTQGISPHQDVDYPLGLAMPMLLFS